MAGLAIGQRMSFAARQEQTAGSPGVRVNEEPPILLLTGSPRKRGTIHGEALRKKIREHVQLWKADIGETYKLDPDAYLAEFLEKSRFEKAIKRWTPDLIEEVEGISEGSGVDGRTMLAFQFMDEQWLFGLHKQYKVPLPDSGCSVLGVYGQKGIPTLLAQTLDLPAFSDGYQILLHIKEGGLEAIVPSYAGLISLCGMNNRGLGVTVNAIWELDHCMDGLPVAFIIRGILQRDSLEGAVNFLRKTRHASGQAYTIGSPQAISSFECSAYKVIPFTPHGSTTRIWHTNHPLASNDMGIWRKFLEKMPPDSPERRYVKNTEARYKALERRLKDVTKPITIREVKEALGSQDDPDYPVCRKKPKRPSATMTISSVIMELYKDPKLHLAPGPSCETNFRTYRF